jgi:hypothetical protein
MLLSLSKLRWAQRLFWQRPKAEIRIQTGTANTILQISFSVSAQSATSALRVLIRASVFGLLSDLGLRISDLEAVL